MNRIAKGLGGFLAVAALTVGLPLLLITIGATPSAITVPANWPELLTTLTTPDDGRIIQSLFIVAVWVGWALMTVLIVVELVSQIRGVRIPKIKALAGPQAAARGLVAATLLLFLAAPIAASAAPTPPAVPPSVTHTQTQTPQPASPSETAPEQPNTRTTQYHVVNGDSLWRIAEKTLGDGRRYQEIADLNYGRAQADGQTLTKDHYVNAGWVLHVPTAEANQQQTTTPTYTVVNGDSLWKIAHKTLGDGDRYQEIADLNYNRPQADGGSLQRNHYVNAGWVLRLPTAEANQQQTTTRTYTVINGDSLWRIAEKTLGDGHRHQEIADLNYNRPQADGGSLQRNHYVNAGWTFHIPQTQAPTQPPQPAQTQSPQPVEPAQTQSPTQPPQPVEQPVEADVDRDEAPFRTAAGVGALAAAGVVGLIAYRRQRQQRLRRAGQQLPMPEGHAAKTEQALRGAADPLSVEAIDHALRGLAHHHAQAGTPLPILRAARLTGEQLDLYLASPATLPEPWSGTVDASVWTLLAEDAGRLIAKDEIKGIPAPFPALVTVGHDLSGGHVFLDLEYLGALHLSGPPDLSQSILAAIAIELATSSWADDLQVTLVGAYPEMEAALQTGRIRYVPTVSQILDELTVRVSQDRHALAEQGAPDLSHARVTGAAPGSWSPEIVLVAGEMTSRQQQQLAEVLNAMPRVAVAAVVKDGEQLGEWSFEVTSADKAVLHPIGLRVTPQRVDSVAYSHILDIASTALAEPTAKHAVAGENPVKSSAEAKRAVPSPPHRDDTKPVAARRARGVAWSDRPTVEDQDAPAEVAQTEDLSTRTPEEMAPTVDHEPEPPAADTPEPSAEPISAPSEADEQDAPVETPEAPIITPTAIGSEEDAAEPTKEDEAEPAEDAEPTSPVLEMPKRHPYVKVLGPIEIEGAEGPVEPSKRARLMEYACYIVLTAGEITFTAIDDALWPNRTNQDNTQTRNTATSKLRRWLSTDEDGEGYLPRHTYQLSSKIGSDWDDFQKLIGADVAVCSTESLDRAIALVRGRPFERAKKDFRRYAWSETVSQEMIAAIVDVATELGRRRLMQGRWMDAETVCGKGINVAPGVERLWRLRILAAHDSRNAEAVQEAIARLSAITDELGCEFEDETLALLDLLKDPTATVDQLREAL